MRIFIVHAHPEPQSFNGAMTRTATEALTSAGHEVLVSDLYAMGFDPISDRRNFVTVHNPNYYRQQAEEAHAAQVDGFAGDIKDEMGKLFWCDALILQFPLWWFGLPAILKGWVDRVFAYGFAYGYKSEGNRYRYGDGGLKGKRAMLSVVVGGPAADYGPRGINGQIEQLLFPITHGTLF